MSRRIAHINYVFIVLFCIASVGGSMAWAQQDIKTQEQQIMTPVSGTTGDGSTDSRESRVGHLYLGAYEAVAGDMSSCENDENCIKKVKGIRFWLCASALCNGTDNSKEPITCFKGLFNNLSTDVQEQINAPICPLIKSPNTEIRQTLLRALLAHFPNTTEDNLVEPIAYLLALKGSALSCEEYIKGYVGVYNPKWNRHWFRALSGCRILSHESTRAQEEKDFYTWFGVVQGSGQCSDIVNTEMRNECNNPRATAALAAD